MTITDKDAETISILHPVVLLVRQETHQQFAVRNPLRSLKILLGINRWDELTGEKICNVITSDSPIRCEYNGDT
jgi:hypothetical protein